MWNSIAWFPVSISTKSTIPTKTFLIRFLVTKNEYTSLYQVSYNDA